MMSDGNTSMSDGNTSMSDGGIRPVVIPARQRVVAAFAVGCFVGSTIVAALTAYGLLRVCP